MLRYMVSSRATTRIYIYTYVYIHFLTKCLLNTKENNKEEVKE